MRSVVEVGASVPAFLGKLWKLVNDCETDHLISWSPGWKTFIIKNQAEFARSLLPLYYKHNNMASFIRQLNMYGFHKITSVENGGLRYEKDEIEFSHPCFMKGHAYLLEHIKRKIANPKSMVASNEGGTKLLVKPELMTKVLADVKQMKGKQESMDAKFSVMKQENEALWREVALLRQKHIKQQQIVNNLIQFLMSLVQPSRTGTMNAHGVKRRYQLMINDAAHNSHFDQSFPKNPKLETDLLDDLNDETLEEGPTIHELVHDDIITTEETPSPVDPNNFVTIDIPGLSPNPRPGSSATPTHYQVTLEDGEGPETAGQLLSPYQVNSNEQTHSNTPAQSPVVTSPSPDFNLVSPTTTKAKASRVSGNHLLSPSQYTISPATDMKLPADIFASDDSASEAGAASMPEINTPLSSPAPAFEHSLGSKDMLLTTAEDLPMYNNLFLTPQPVNAKLDKSTESNKRSERQAITDAIDQVNIANIKTELQDGDWNNMTLAKVNNSGNLSRVPTMNLRDIFNNNEDRTSKFGSNKSKNELDDHLDTMHSDLESLRELLRSDSYSLDANTLLGLFGQEDPFYGLNFNTVDDRTKGNANAQEPNQLMSYTGNVPDFGDFSLPEDTEVSQEESLTDSLLGDESALNTPQVTLQSPFYPTTTK